MCRRAIPCGFCGSRRREWQVFRQSQQRQYRPVIRLAPQQTYGRQYSDWFRRARGGSACSTEGETIYGDLGREGTLPLFDAAVEKCRKAQRLTGLKFSGVIWLQGERDSNAVNAGCMTGADYERALKNLIARFRRELGADLPFYIVLTGQYVHRPEAGFLAVRAAQRRVAATVPGVRLVAADPWIFPEMNMMTDDIHYSQFAYNLIGEVIARQIAEERLK